MTDLTILVNPSIELEPNLENFVPTMACQSEDFGGSTLFVQ